MPPFSRSILERNDSILLTLTGIHISGERNKTNYPNLGKARAEAIKKVLIEAGVNESNIETASFKVGDKFIEEGKLNGGVHFAFSTRQSESELVATAELVATDEMPEELEPVDFVFNFY